MELLVLFGVLLVGILLGVGIGIFIGTDRMRKSIGERTLGRLRIDHSEPDEPARLFVELMGSTPDMIAQDKFVIFEVVNESYISHN